MASGAPGGNMMMMVMLMVLAGAIYLFGCKLGICAVCNFRKDPQAPAKCAAGPIPGAGSPCADGSTPSATTGLCANGKAPIGIGTPASTPASQLTSTTTPPDLTTATQFNPPAGTAVNQTDAMQALANQVVNDIDKYTYAQFSSAFVLNMLAYIIETHKQDLADIWQFNNMTLSPLTGRALAAYSELVLNVCREKGIALNPAADAMFRGNLFAGTPLIVGQKASLAHVLRVA